MLAAHTRNGVLSFAELSDSTPNYEAVMKVVCHTCQIEFDKIPSQIKKSNNHYCSRSCSAKSTNKTPKRVKTKKCKTCQDLIFAKQIYCSNCSNGLNIDKALKDVMYDKHHKSSAYALVRVRARAIAKKLGWNKCCQCGYDKHIEIAHIKPINSFSLETMLSIINHESNLKPLCPNCHWEHDHQ